MSEMTGEDPVEQALRTELILQGIFKFLRTRDLLGCSQVNKLWNYQARLIIRDHRKCTVRMFQNPCGQLKAFEEIMGGMPIAPFNSLEIPLGRHSGCSEGGLSAVFRDDNLRLKLKLKHVFIASRPGLEKCPATLILVRLLRHNAREIKSLRLLCFPPLLVQLWLRVQPEFPKLEQLELEGMHGSSCEGGGDLIKSITRVSSKLKSIVHDGDTQILQILPQDKYHLLTKFGCDDSAQSTLNGLEERCMTLAKSGPALTDLLFWINSSNEQRIRRSYEMLQLFLCSSHKSLETMFLFRICPLQSMMGLPPLEKLSYLRLNSFVGSERFMDMIWRMQFGRLFPKIQHVYLECFEGGPALPIFDRSPQLEDEREVEVLPGSPHSSMSTTLVQLTADVSHISWVKLKQVFPLATNLSLLPTSNSSHAIPFRQIFRLWPYLKTLSVSGQARRELYNCDSEFCGIDHAEVELLWPMEEAELRNLHIVPRRPCPILMPNLELIEITFSLAYNFDALPKERSRKFLSVVTKCLLLERVPGLKLLLGIQRGDDHETPIFYIND